MGHSTKLLLVAVIAALLLAVGGSAQANRSIRVSPTVQTSSAAVLTFEWEGTKITCEVVMRLRNNELVGKVLLTEVGTTTLEFRGCFGATLRALAERQPLTISYVNFFGTLPGITAVGLEVRGFAFLLEAVAGAVRCLYSGPLRMLTVGTPITSWRVDETRAIPLATRLGATCPASVTVSGSIAHERAVTLTLV